MKITMEFTRWSMWKKYVGLVFTLTPARKKLNHHAFFVPVWRDSNMEKTCWIQVDFTRGDVIQCKQDKLDLKACLQYV